MMFCFDDIENNKEEAIRLVNKIIVDEINYINKLCFVYSWCREKYPHIFEENLKSLLGLLKDLREIKEDFEHSIEGIYDSELTLKVNPLSKTMRFSQETISANIDLMIDSVIEESEVNSIGMEKIIEYLERIDDQAFMSFISKMRDINDNSVNYIARSISVTDENNRYKR